MRAALLATTMLLATVRTALADPVEDALYQKANSCIEINAAKVGALSPNPHEAVNFLVDDLCVTDISHIENYAQNAQTLTQWRATQAASQLAGVSINSTTGELITPPGFSPPLNASLALVNALHNSVAAREKLRAIAAQAVLNVKPSSAH